MARYRFLQSYAAPHRFTGTANTRMFSAGEVISAVRYAPPAGTSAAVAKRMAPAVVVDNQYIIPLNILRAERTSQVAGTVVVPEDKMVDVKGAINAVSSGGVQTGAIVGVIGGALISFVTKKNIFLGAGIGMVAGGALGYLFSMSPKKISISPVKK